MNVSEAARYRNIVSGIAAGVLFLIGLAFGTSPMHAILTGGFSVVVGLFGLEISLYVTALGWLLIAKLTRTKVHGWVIGHFFRNGKAKVQTRRLAASNVIFYVRSILPATQAARIAVLGGFISALVWAFLCLTFLPVALLISTDWFWRTLCLFVGACACIALHAENRADPTPTALWQYFQSRSQSPVLAAVQVIERKDALFRDGYGSEALSEADIQALDTGALPLQWRIVAQKVRCTWFDSHGRREEAQQVADKTVALILESKALIAEKNISTHLLRFAPTYAEWGQFERAQELSDQIVHVSDTLKSSWNALQAQLALHHGDRETADRLFEEAIKTMTNIEFNSREAERRFLTRLRKDYPDFVHVMDPAFASIFNKEIAEPA
jgi:hypothetical protein